MKRLFALVVLMVAGTVCRTLAQTPDDQYVRIYGLMQRADSLSSSGRSAEALRRYLEAQTALQKLQRIFPDYSPKVVKFRLEYLNSKIQALSTQAGKTPERTALPPATSTQGTPRPAAELERQLTALQEAVRGLQADKTILEAKLKEALATQPAAVDPRELAKAQDRVKSLMKENDLLKTSLIEEQGKSTRGAEPKVLEQTRQALAEANRKLAEQTESTKKLAAEKDTLQSRMAALTSNAEAAEALRAENQLLQRQVAELKSAPAAKGDSARQLAQVEAQFAALQSEAEILRLEKIALQNRIRSMSAPPVVRSVIPVPSREEDTQRIKQLEAERDDLHKKLETANKELYGRKGKDIAARIDELSGEITILRARLEVFEARAVPYTSEELALFKAKQPKIAAADTNTGKRPVTVLPEGTANLAAEAQRHFAAHEYDQAEANYMDMLRQDEKNVYTLANLAAIQLELNRLDDAEKHINQALAIAPDDGYSLSILGYLRFRQEKYDQALDALSRAAKLNPQSAEIQNYLGVTLSHKGLRGPAETALRKAIQLDPTYASAHNNLAVIYAGQNPPLIELARWHYKKALAAGQPANPELERMLDQKSAADSK